MGKKSIVKNSLYNVFYKGFRAFFPVITMAYISRVLLAEGIGKVEYARSIVDYFAVAAALGIPNYGIKIIAQNNSNIEQRSKSFWEMFYINACSTIVCSIFYYLLISCFSYFNNRGALFYIMGAIVVLNIINIDWYYQGIEEYKYITIRSIVIKILSFFLMLIFVKSKEDYLVYAVILCLASAGNYFFNIIHVRKHIVYVPITDCDIKRHLKPIFILLGATLATEIYTMLDTVILEYLHGELYVGYYQNCIKIVRLIYTMAIAMVATFYPRISFYIKEKKYEESDELLTKGFKILLLISCPASLGILLSSDYIVPILLGTSFLPSIGCLKIVSVLIIVFSFAYLLGHIILMASGNESRILVATIIGALINSILNFILIPRFYHYGAAIASVIAEILVTILLITKARKYFKINVNLKFYSSLLFSLLGMSLVVVLVKLLRISDIPKLIICVIGGSLIYFVLLFLLKVDIVIEIKSMLIKKIKRAD